VPDQTTPHLPKLRHYKPKDLGVVRIDGRDIYLGRYDTAECQERYRRAVAEWLVGKQPSPPTADAKADDPGPSVAELILAYLRHVDAYYVKGGRPTSEATLIKLAMRVLRGLYGLTPARAFGPLALKAVRQAFIDSGLCRTEVNRRTGLVVRFFRWASENEMVPPEGLVPSWADDPAIGNKLINARAETVQQKPSFRSVYRKRRCLVPRTFGSAIDSKWTMSARRNSPPARCSLSGLRAPQRARIRAGGELRIESAATRSASRRAARSRPRNSSTIVSAAGAGGHAIGELSDRIII
jgi:hypothetical protein